MRNSEGNILIYIGLLDLIILFINSIYHFIIHGFYKTLLGIIFLIATGLFFILAILTGQSKMFEDVSMLSISALSVFISCFLIGVLIGSLAVSKPIFLIIEWIIPIVILISFCIKEDI